MGFKIEGLDKLEKELKRMQSSAKDLQGEREVSFEELFIPEFMREHTKFQSFEELLTAGGFEVNSKKDFEAIPDDEFDEHVSKTTNFDNWEDMLSTAGTEYYARKLGF